VTESGNQIGRIRAIRRDFRQQRVPRGVARLLALEGQPPATPLLPVRLLPRDTCLMELPSVFEGIPALDLPKYR
jgi:hypothetical protein